MSLVKKFISILAAAVMIMCLGSGVFAGEPSVPENIEIGDLFFDDGNEEDYAEANAELMAIGAAATRLRFSKTLSVTRYRQWDDAWGDDLMQMANVPIRSNGCALTAFTMIENYWNNSGKKPGEINIIIGDAACPIKSAVAASRVNMTRSAYKDTPQTQTDTINFAVGAISGNRPVMIGMVGPTTHFVTAYGFDGTTIYIKDPNRDDISTLQQYFAMGYSVNRLTVFN